MAVRAVFVMEIGLGHTTFYRNLRRAVEADPEIDPEWIEITFDQPGLLGRIPKLRNDIRLRAGIQARRKLSRALKNRPADVLFFHTQMPAWLCVGFVKRTPTIISIDGTQRQFSDVGYAYGLRPPGNSWLQRQKESRDADVFRGAAAVSCFSRWAAEGVRREYGLEASRLHVIPPGVDLDDWKAGSPHADGTVRLLFVGGEFWRKGGDLLVRWMNEQAPENCTLDIVSGDDIPPARRTTVHRGLTANAPELRALYQQADLFVLPTRGDLSPLVLMEAMGSGLPVLSTEIAAIPEMLDGGELGKAGWLSQPGDWDSFAAKLSELVAEPGVLANTRIVARTLSERQFDAKTNLGRELELIRSVAKPASGREGDARARSSRSIAPEHRNAG